ncbi:uncharacterized protein LOC122711778 isoform X2 [Apis laboriosa]|uniref:uncharacterized protein LOC122711778 isoform X2 n=1 Tax=Apis laboriosa TaxID=183418 RepID=UPI001CC51C24|nr:uncharacterized protein LOC122711778 isoform X2 [Apis laboriosa]
MQRRERGRSRGEGKGSQNDIKKLRRENEQLRREIWSLRDEYDKLEEILKRQKSRGESEEYEDRSDEDDDVRSDYSEEGEEFSENGQEDATKEPEQLENAENQKISTEKMANSALHRLHVDFDDLSVVDEEEEPKRDKKEISSEDNSQFKEEKSPLSILKSRQLHENVSFYPDAYQSPTCLSSPAYYTECPFKFPSTLNLMMSTEPASMLTTPCPSINADPIIPIDPLLPSVSLGGPSVDQINDQILHAPPAGWQSNVMIPETQVATFETTDVNLTSVQTFAEIRQDQAKPVEQMIGGFALPTFHRRKIDGSIITNNTINPNVTGSTRENTENVVENGWSTNRNLKDSLDQGEKRKKEESSVSGSEKPKHFFAPLPSKVKKQNDESSPTISYLGTGNSSSSDKTGSTIILKNQLMKGSLDVYVNGAVPYEDNFLNNKGEQRTFLSTDNLLIENAKSSIGNQLTKSMSWQDLSIKSQPVSANQAEGKQQMLTRSDNTLDNISDSKPYKSYLNVTLKPPRAEEVPAALEQAASPDTPEIPKLPTIDYRLFKNPFLRNFEAAAGYMNQNNITRPLSVQVNDDNLCYYPMPHPETSTFKRRMTPFGDKYRQTDQNRLLIPTNQLVNGKLMSPVSKHQIQVTSFERPSPHTLIGPSTPYEFNAGRRLNPNPYLHGQNIYQNVSYFSRGCSVYPQREMMYYDNLALKVAAQTQTSIDGDSHHEDEHALSHEESAPSTPSGQRRKRMIRKEKGNVGKEQKSLSPTAQRRLKKQGSVTSSEVPESPGKVTARKRTRRLSITTTTTSEGQEDKNESRSSSSGQDSPKKEQLRRVSLYFNAKKRPSLTSMRTVRSGSLDMGREKEALNSERERTNSVSSREIGNEAKTRKASTSSGNVPWCACWGNGCV